MNSQQFVAGARTPRCRPLHAKVEAIRIQTGRRHNARRLALRLAYVHHIPPFETALAPWLAPVPGTNADALSAWVRAELADPGLRPCAGTTALLDALSERLTHRLADIEASRSW